ncbi:hypothetical protein, partial [Dermacoccus nishinomiyaensis]|uniref:hypothetical protein n=1 Tax=Dermacoccus nishinomiyaensis TaxID=1274 RepID=UPI0036F4429B
DERDGLGDGGGGVVRGFGEGGQVRGGGGLEGRRGWMWEAGGMGLLEGWKGSGGVGVNRLGWGGRVMGMTREVEMGVNLVEWGWVVRKVMLGRLRLMLLGVEGWMIKRGDGGWGCSLWRRRMEGGIGVR